MKQPALNVLEQLIPLFAAGKDHHKRLWAIAGRPTCFMLSKSLTGPTVNSDTGKRLSPGRQGMLP